MTDQVPVLDQAPEDEPLLFPASSGQQRLWLLDRLEHGSTAYTIPFVVRLHGPLDTPALGRTLSRLVERHEILRTGLESRGEDLLQRVDPPAPFDLTVLDATSEGDAEAHAREIVARLLAAPFDLARGPLLRASVIRLASQEHVLAIAMHHCVGDGWSIGVLKRDLAELYAAEREGRPAALPPLEIQYGDFASWEREWLRSPQIEHQLSYWRRVLDDAPTLLELPTDRPRPVVPSAGGDRRRRQVDGKLGELVRAYARDQEATVFVVLLASLAALLARHSDQRDVVIGTPVAGRHQTELEHLIGFFTNTLAIRTRLEDDPSFTDLVRRVREGTLDALSNQELPFERVVAELAPQRTLSHAPIFQVLFTLHHASGRPLDLLDLNAVEMIDVERHTAKFDLSFVIVESDAGLRVSCEYATDLFDDETIDRLLEQYEILLEGVVTDPERRVSAVPLMRDAARELVLKATAPVAPNQPVGCLHDIFEQQVQRAPHATAVVHEGTTLTYSQLDQRANQLAHRLRALGVTREERVALCFEPSLDMVVAVLAAVKAGGVYVPLDPDYPLDRKRFMLEDTQARVLVTSAALAGRLPEHSAALVRLDTDAQSLATEPTTAPDAGVTPESLAYVIYTSGSTGRPKGVQIEHANVARLFSATAAWFDFGPGDIWALLHSYAFDFSVWEMWGALLHGGKLVVPPRLTVRSPAALARLLAFERVTVLNATPSLFFSTMDELLTVGEGLALRTVIFGGEALRPAGLARWFARYGSRGPQLVNMYGITETTVHVTYRPIEAAEVDAAGSPIGIPIPDLSLYVLDAAGQPVPIGVPGEIHVGGAGLARGYINRPELTAERFIANPFGPGRLYRTGDRARRLPDGGLDYLGRADAQVKIRGHRIELGEIETVLLGHDLVAEAAVVAVEAGPGDTRLAAYIVPAPEAPPDPAGLLKDHAKVTLPAHMVPASITTVSSLPLTANGKLDRRALPAPTWGSTSRRSTPPRTRTERALADIWCRILKIESVGVDDSFFDLGGHSMLAVSLFAAIKERLGVRLPLAILFTGDTISDLALAVDREQMASDEWATIVPLRAEGSRPPLFVVSLQNLNSDFLPYRQLVEQLGPDQPVYGLQTPGMDGRRLPMGRVEDIAALYVEELRAFQPGGPHLLLGLAYAGMIAYEMARQLAEAGEPPVLLAMLHSAPFGRKSEPVLKVNDWRSWQTWLERRRWNLNHKLGVAYFRYLEDHRRHRPRWTPWDLHLMASSSARSRYVAPPIDTPIDWFGIASERHRQFALRWAGVARGGLDYHGVVGGEHDEWHNGYLKRPHVGAIAAAMSTVIDRRLSER
jgi:amino acid adenylation domain-containing protein